ncbi:MAG: aspartyl protease family protein [Candidatus Acidiferrales bacterium]
MSNETETRGTSVRKWIGRLISSRVIKRIVRRIAAASLVVSSAQAAFCQSCRPVKAEFSGSEVFLSTQVNDNGQFWFVLDSGTQPTIETKAVVGAFVDTHPTSPVQTLTFSRFSFMPDPRSMWVGTIGWATASNRHQLDGIVGDPLLRRFVVQLDYDKETVVFCPQGSHPKGPLGAAFRLKSPEYPPIVHAELNLKGQKFGVDLEVDTGADAAVTLFAPFSAKNSKFQSPSGPKLPVLGPDGRRTVSLAKVNSLRVGQFAIKDVIVNLEQPQASDSMRTVDGLLGKEFLRRFTITFDYPSNQIYLKPNRHYKEPPYNFPGVWFVPNDNKDRTSAIFAKIVVPGSPAGVAGIRKGDELISVDGKSVAGYWEYPLEELWRGYGRTVHLVLRRNGQTILIRFKLRKWF